jgi:hypothetical protein
VKGPDRIALLANKTHAMKKKIFGFVIALVLAAAANAQGILLNAYGNYVFDDKIDSYYSTTNYFSGTLKGGFLWGAGLEFRLKEYYGLELMYMRLDTDVPVNYWLNGDKRTTLKAGINYIMANGVRSFPTQNPKIEPFGGFGLGMAIIDAENPDNNNKSNSATKFAWDMRFGINIWTGGRVGIKLQTLLISVPQGAGGGLYFGTGGASAGVTTYSSIYQFVLGGGLVFKLGSAAKK